MEVWVFRKAAGSKDKLCEFEYLGFSAFWGIVLMMILGMMAKFKAPPTDVIQAFGNPLVAGFCMSLMGMAGAALIGKCFRRIKK